MLLDYGWIPSFTRNMRNLFLFLLITLFTPLFSHAQQSPYQGEVEDLKKEILSLKSQQEVTLQYLDKYRKRFNFGLIMATIGYTTVVAGGQLLGGSNDDLGRGMLYVGGALGIAGTVVLIDAGKFMKRATNPPPESVNNF